jgi:hypothetical protein
VFGRKNKLLRNGTLARAAIREADAGGYTNSHGERRYKLRLSVEYPDGTTGDVTCHAFAPGAAGAYVAGETVPVRYDPDDPSKVDVDVEQYHADRLQALAESREQLMRAADARHDDA